jgi:hypothetical protein
MRENIICEEGRTRELWAFEPHKKETHFGINIYVYNKKKINYQMLEVHLYHLFSTLHLYHLFSTFSSEIINTIISIYSA